MANGDVASRAWPKPAAIGLGLAIILGLIAVNTVIFEQVFDLDFLGWYVADGALIGLLTSIATKLWGEAESNVDLIAAHPLVYLRACCMLAGAPLFAAGTVLRGGRRGGAGDVILATILLLAVGLGLILWILVVVPPQYFVYLVCGAPARLSRDSPTVTAYVEETGGRVTIAEVPRDSMPDGAKNVDLFAQPVPATALISSGVMYLVGALIV